MIPVVEGKIVIKSVYNEDDWKLKVNLVLIQSNITRITILLLHELLSLFLGYYGYYDCHFDDNPIILCWSLGCVFWDRDFGS